MPTLANITVKKADGTTDVVYTALTGSSGDKTPARWRNATVGVMPAESALFEISSRSNAAGTARRVDVNYVWPTTRQDAGGNKVVDGKMSATASILIPQNQTAAVLGEQCHQFANLLASALVKATLVEGYAPR